MTTNLSRKSEPVENLLAATGIVLLFIAVIVIGITIYQFFNMRHLRDEGIVVQATITDKYTRQVSSGRGTSTQHVIDVMYFDEPTTGGEDTVLEFEFLDAEITLPSTKIGDFHSDDIAISEERFNQFQDNERIAILYHPDEPDEAWVADVVYNWSAGSGLGFTAILGVPGILLLVAAVRKGFGKKKSQ